MKAQLAAAVSRMSEREQLILSLYYYEELTMKEVSEVVGIAVSRVSQIHAAAMFKLRISLGPSSGNNGGARRGRNPEFSGYQSSAAENAAMTTSSSSEETIDRDRAVRSQRRAPFIPATFAMRGDCRMKMHVR